MIKPGDKIIDKKSGKELVAVRARDMNCDLCFYKGKSCMHIDCVNLDDSDGLYYPNGVIFTEEDKANEVDVNEIDMNGLVCLQDAVNAFCKICNATEDSEMCKKFIEKLKGKLYEKQI